MQCRLCGSVPAVKATFRGHQGMLIIMRFLKMSGPFCRSCGLAVFRDMSAKTLVQGWYGYFSFLATPVTVLWNLIASRKVRALAAPRPALYGPSRPPMDPGDRLLMRPMAIIGLAIPFVLVFALIALATATSD